VSSRVRLLAFAAALGLVAAAASCGASHHSPTAPAATSRPAEGTALVRGTQEPDGQARRGEFYPLAPGNRWHYQLRDTLKSVDALGNTVSQAEFSTGTIEHLQTCLEDLGGRRYQIERVVENRENFSGTIRTWIRIRQKGRGLYEADVDLGDAPACEGDVPVLTAGRMKDQACALEEQAARRAIAAAPAAARAAYEQAWQRVRTRREMVREQMRGLSASSQRRNLKGPPEGELLRLRYPLFVGQHWIIRMEPRFEARVEDLDVLQLAPGAMRGWRIRYTNAFLGPLDRVYVWYGRQGFLRLLDHFEESMGPFGSFIFEETQTLDSLSLVGPPALFVGTANEHQ
jgi:hypothetical protein